MQHTTTPQYNSTLYYKIKYSRVEARWSLTRPTTAQSSNTLTCSLRNDQTQTEYYTKIPRLYVAQYLRCESEPSAKRYVQSAEKACRLQLHNYLQNTNTIYRTHTPQCTHKRSSDTQSLTMYTSHTILSYTRSPATLSISPYP